MGLYILSALLAAVAGILIAGLVKTASLALVDQYVLPAVAAAVIGGTSIMGGRGGYSGTIIGALILTVLTSLLIALQMPESCQSLTTTPTALSAVLVLRSFGSSQMKFAFIWCRVGYWFPSNSCAWS